MLLGNADWQAVGYRLPVVELLPRDREDDAVGHLGPDLLGPDWDPAEAVRRLAADPDREIGQALLDQRNLAGIGNLYKSRGPASCGASPPWTPVRDVDLATVVDRAHRLLDLNKDHAWQTTTGDRSAAAGTTGSSSAGPAVPALRHADRDGGAGRGAVPADRYWCPVCQPGPAPEPQRPPRRAERPPGRTRYRP